MAPGPASCAHIEGRRPCLRPRPASPSSVPFASFLNHAGHRSRCRLLPSVAPSILPSPCAAPRQHGGPSFGWEQPQLRGAPPPSSRASTAISPPPSVPGDSVPCLAAAAAAGHELSGYRRNAMVKTTSARNARRILRAPPLVAVNVKTISVFAKHRHQQVQLHHIDTSPTTVASGSLGSIKSLDDKCITMRIVPSTPSIPRRSSTCTPTPHGNAKYPSCRQDPQVGPRTIDDSWTMYNYRRPEDVGFVKYLTQNETYTATVARIETDKSEDATTTLNHVRRPSPKTRVMQMSSSTTVA
ncbi:hypothetical protein VPH35_122558 [Triticum aestivum]